MELGLLFLFVQGFTRLGEGKRVVRIDQQLNPAMFRAEVIGSVRPLTAAAIGNGRAQHDKLREIVVERTEARNIAGTSSFRESSPS